MIAENEHAFVMGAFMLECAGLLFVLLTVQIPCVQTGEVSLFINIYGFVILAPMITDFGLLIKRCIFDFEPTQLVVMMNYVFAVTNMIGGVSLVSILFFLCGNPLLGVFIVSGVFTIIAGVGHIFIALHLHRKLSDFFMRFERTEGLMNFKVVNKNNHV